MATARAAVAGLGGGAGGNVGSLDILWSFECKGEGGRL